MHFLRNFCKCKVNYVSCFGKNLKNVFMFHVLAEFFFAFLEVEDAFFMQFLQVQSGLCFMFRGKIWKTSLCFMFWLNFFWKLRINFYAIFLGAKWVMYHKKIKIWKTSLCFMFWLNFSRKVLSLEWFWNEKSCALFFGIIG